MQTRWLDRDDPDRRDLAGAAAIMEACRATDHPGFAVRTLSWLTGEIRHGFDGDVPDVLLAVDDSGTVAGVSDAWFARWDNPHLVFASVLVDPARRRCGIGKLLFEELCAAARRDGRTVVVSDSADRPEYRAFATAMGMAEVYGEVFRRQDLVALNRAKLDHEFDAALPYAADYELIRLPGAVPDELVDHVVTLTAAINDAPHTTELEMDDEVFTAERLRAFERAHEGRGIRLYRVAARHRHTGELAGHTMVAIDTEQPWYADQYDTSVLSTHRGHRLGLLLKIDMLRWLASAEPQLRHLDTANAASNEHMIQVNEMLGYEVFDRTLAWQITLD